MPSSPEKPYHALKGGIDKAKPKEVKASMAKAAFWYKFGKGYDKRHIKSEYSKISGLKSPAEVNKAYSKGTIDKWVAGKSSADRLKTHDSLYPILFRFFEKVYSGNNALKHKETKMALARLVKQGFNVDYIPAGGEFMIEGNKLFIKTAGSSDWDHCNGLWIMLDEVDGSSGGGAPGGATQRGGGSSGGGGGAAGGATPRGGGAAGGATPRGGGAAGGATPRGGGAAGGATPRGGGAAGGATPRGGGAAGGATPRNP